jgi:hypothetical protein
MVSGQPFFAFGPGLPRTARDRPKGAMVAKSKKQAGSSGCGDHVFDLVPEEQGTTENTEHT